MSADVALNFARSRKRAASVSLAGARSLAIFLPRKRLGRKAGVGSSADDSAIVAPKCGGAKKRDSPSFPRGRRGPEGRPPPRKEGLSLFFLARRFGLGVHFGDRVRRARAAVGDELVEHVARSEERRVGKAWRDGWTR